MNATGESVSQASSVVKKPAAYAAHVYLPRLVALSGLAALFFLIGGADLSQFGYQMAGMALVLGLISYFEYNNLPTAYSFEGEKLNVVDVSGAVLVFERWIIARQHLLRSLQAQNRYRTLSLPLGAYQNSAASVPQQGIPSTL